jgi:hypothetical protein
MSRAAIAGACVLALALAGCDRVPKPKADEPAAPTAPAAPAPAPVSQAPAEVPAAVTAPAVAAAPAPALAATRKVPVTLQGVAAAGLTVRVKGVEVGGDATVLDVSISFANRITNNTMLALVDTYLEDESGARLHIKRPENNRNITVNEGETVDGQLVFLGSVPTSARSLKLVFNDGNQGDNIVAPGLTIKLPLQDA